MKEQEDDTFFSKHLWKGTTPFDSNDDEFEDQEVDSDNDRTQTLEEDQQFERSGVKQCSTSPFTNLLTGFHLLNWQFMVTNSVTFREDGFHLGEYSSRVASIQSSIRCGWNLPNHKMLFVSFDVFKPFFTFYRHPDSTVLNAQTLDAYNVWTQGIGRIARQTKFEKENPSFCSKRILFISKSTTFPAFISVFLRDIGESYKNIQMIDFSYLEKEMATLFRKNIGISAFVQLHKKHALFQNSFPKLIETSEDFRFWIFEKRNSFFNKNDTSDFETKNLFFYRKRFHFILVLCEVAQKFSKKLWTFEEETSKTSKGNPLGLPSASEVMRPSNITKKNDQDQAMFLIVKAAFVDFLKQEKSNDYLFFSKSFKCWKRNSSFLNFWKICKFKEYSYSSWSISKTNCSFRIFNTIKEQFVWNFK